MRNFFEKNLPWWEIRPANEIVRSGKAYALSLEGKCYAAYMPEAQRIVISLAPGNYTALWFDPRSGDYSRIPGNLSAGTWQSPDPPHAGDWVLLIKSGM